MEAPPNDRVRAPLQARRNANPPLAGRAPVRAIASWATARRRPGVAPRWKPWFRVSAT